MVNVSFPRPIPSFWDKIPALYRPIAFLVPLSRLNIDLSDIYEFGPILAFVFPQQDVDKAQFRRKGQYQ